MQWKLTLSWTAGHASRGDSFVSFSERKARGDVTKQEKINESEQGERLCKME